jgi:hypothetical protein
LTLLDERTSDFIIYFKRKFSMGLRLWSVDQLEQKKI